MARRAVDWADLPNELLAIIGKSLDPWIDVPRFRGVCTSWRSSIPPTHALSPRFPLEFQKPMAVLKPEFGGACLCESTLYLLKPLDPFLASTSSCNEGWLIMVQNSGSGRLRLSDFFMGFLYQLKPMTLNLLNFRIVELGKAYAFRQLGTCYDFDSTLIKVVMSPNSASTNAYESAAFLILDFGKLAFARYGDEKLTLLNDQVFGHEDIIVYKGQFYFVDKYGTLWWIESSSLKMIQFSSPLSNPGNRKYLVESRGSLYLVVQYFNFRENHISKSGICPSNLVDLHVYKLDELCGQWVLMKSLGDHAFLLGFDYSFSVPASELVGCKKNCIYLFELITFGYVFDMEDHSIQDLGVCGVFDKEDLSIQDLGVMHNMPFCVAPTWFFSTNP